MMDSQETQALIAALQRYFDQAKPDNDAHNAAISRADRERYGGKMLLMAPAVIVDGLRNFVMMQTLASRDDADADRELEVAGVHLLWCYRSLVKAYGSGGVMSLLMTLPLTDVEDVVTLNAYTLASLTEDADPMIRVALEGAHPILEAEFNQRYGTGCKIALAYALLRLGQQEPFRSFAPPYLTDAVPRKTLEKLAASHRREEQRLLERHVVGAIILDIASNGRAIPPHLGWKRKPE